MCMEGWVALMNMGTVVTVSTILFDDTHRSELEELWIVAGTLWRSQGYVNGRSIAASSVPAYCGVRRMGAWGGRYRLCRR
ncbi:hypothetical protein E2562_022631 [Oryza meyeriana var. granulata]|uniref:Uncharacterized protein n=1 Tax=Oryza meyeriana var. granulata TaxID=110450 RepID=A0A6G1CS59_9ORYZ|nr:hypothetical protein E2562_022631 [Oryza meyeriana var. granulata]